MGSGHRPPNSIQSNRDFARRLKRLICRVTVLVVLARFHFSGYQEGRVYAHKKASCPRYCDEVGSAILTKEQEQEISENLPAFDTLTARSARDNGTLFELFRTYPGSRVNRYVARFVVWDRQADYLISDQPWEYAFGRHSALDRFLALDGEILLLGSGHDAVTFLHYVEHAAKMPNKRIRSFQVPIMEDGRRILRSMKEFDPSGDGAHANWPDRFFAKIVDAHIGTTGNEGGRIGNGLSYVLRARGLLNFAQPVMELVAIDPRATHNLNNRDACLSSCLADGI